mmetsp:Transcript_218/g.553  ORF Transcript_218/g.553 Transcript_218/m.553 type:complete len:104 (+) Transcript_218:58-369(+)
MKRHHTTPHPPHCTALQRVNPCNETDSNETFLLAFKPRIILTLHIKHCHVTRVWLARLVERRENQAGKPNRQPAGPMPPSHLGMNLTWHASRFCLFAGDDLDE